MNETRQERLAKAESQVTSIPITWRSALWVVAGVLMVLDLYLIFMVAPIDAVLGNVQRVFYFHVPLAWVAFLAFFFVFAASLGYLFNRSPRWDAVAQASAEVGVLFCTMVLITGVIWARPVWGVWWAWEPRLTTTLILWLIYVAYLMIRSYAPSPAQGARYAAILGVVGFADVPIVYFSVTWWRAVHPGFVVGPAAQSGSLEPIMTRILMFSLLVFTVLFVMMLWERVSLKHAEEDLKLAKQNSR